MNDAISLIAQGTDWLGWNGGAIGALEFIVAFLIVGVFGSWLRKKTRKR